LAVGEIGKVPDPQRDRRSGSRPATERENASSQQKERGEANGTTSP
jgi:hypothetical protein